MAENDYPVLAVRDTIIFPHMVVPLFVGRDQSLRAVQAASEAQQPLLIVAQKEAEIQEPGPEDLYSVGTLAAVSRVLRIPDGSTSVLIEGRQRAQIDEFTQTRPYLRARATPLLSIETARPPVLEALMRACLALFEKCVHLSQNLPEEALVTAMNADEPGWLADVIASTLNLPIAQRQEILETLEPSVRLQRLSILLAKEVEVLELENKIQTQVQEEVEKNQREYLLREQMRVIQSELGEMDTQM
ncbi:MAG: LON peptidase substrate-binding domain-containing protein, partial [Chloroflexi bacterium]|nr:LON peptidase substrate-binding domain-containing protein [Chloroflexota bacterium]